MRRDDEAAREGAAGMQVLVNTDHGILGGAGLADRIRSDVEVVLQRVSDRITRVEVHLSDENGAKGGDDDKRCTMEARIERRQPIAVTNHAATADLSAHGAAVKLAKLIEKTLGRSENAHHGTPHRDH